jgi:hypothetical protein
MLGCVGRFADFGSGGEDKRRKFTDRRCDWDFFVGASYLRVKWRVQNGEWHVMIGVIRGDKGTIRELKYEINWR